MLVKLTRPSYQSWLPGMANSSGASAASARQRRPVRTEHAVLVLDRLGHRVHLVAAHDEDPPPLGGVGLAVPVELELLGGQQPGHGVGRVPAVAEVGHVVEPQLGRLGAVGDLGRLERLQLAVVGVGAEHARQQHPDGRVDELVGIEPAHHRPAHEPELGRRGRARRTRARAASAVGGLGHLRAFPAAAPAVPPPAYTARNHSSVSWRTASCMSRPLRMTSIVRWRSTIAHSACAATRAGMSSGAWPRSWSRAIRASAPAMKRLT